MIAEEKKNRPELFVAYILKRMNGDKEKGIKPDTGFTAALRRADNPATEYQSWEYLAKWCNLDKDWERLSFALVASSLAKSRPKRDGYVVLGQAIAKSYEENGRRGNEQDSAKAKLRRLLASKTAVEACEILRPILSLIASRQVMVCHAKLLNDLLYFGEKTKIRWASDFYGKPKEVGE